MTIPDTHPNRPSARTIPISEFKSKCLAILKGLGREGLIVTRRGRPVAMVVPHPTESASLIGCMRDELEFRGDLLSTGIDWESDAQP